MNKKLLLTYWLVLSTVIAFAQLTVTVSNTGNTLPNLASSYTSLASAIAGLNAVTTFSGPVILSCSGTSEIAPAGGFLINYTAATTAINNVVIDGGNTTIKAAAIGSAGGAATGQSDAVIKIVGSDNLTIQNFTITENSANTVEGALAAQKMTEFGIGLFAASATDGAQNNTIQNNIITMSNGGVTYRNAIGIFSSTTAAHTAPATARLATSNAGTNSNNKIYGNTITGVAHGIYFVAPPQTATVFESGIDIGGTSPSTGNNITFGVSNTTSDLTWAYYSGSVVAGVYFRNGVLGFNVRYNTIANKPGLTLSNGGMYNTVDAAPAGIATAHTSTFSNNTCTITQTASVSIYGADFGGGLNSTSIECNDNTITIKHTVITNNTAADYLIKSDYPVGYANVNNNILNYSGYINSRASSVTNSGDIYGIVLGDAKNVINNIITFNKTDSQAINLTSTFSGLTIGVKSINSAYYNNLIINLENNIIYLNDSVVPSNGNGSFVYDFYGILTSGYNRAEIFDNNITTGSTGNCRSTNNFTGISCDWSLEAYNNIIYTNRNASNAAGTNGIINIGTGCAPCCLCFSSSIYNNNITLIAPAGSCTGVFVRRDWNLYGMGVSNNTIAISGSASNIVGVQVSGGGVSNNNFSISTSNANSPSIFGILMQGSTYNMGMGGFINSNVFNNISATATGSTSAPVISAVYVGETRLVDLSINDNLITGMYAAAGLGNAKLTGIYLSDVYVYPIYNCMSSCTGRLMIYRNKIHNLNNNASGAAASINLIKITGTNKDVNDTVNIYNNLLSQSTTLNGFNNPDGGLMGINISSVDSGLRVNIYHNTIYLNTTSTGANFGAYGLYHNTSTTSKTAALYLRNNIIVNNVTPRGTGVSYAYKISSSNLNNFASPSDNNLFYCASGIFNNGNNTDLTIAGYKNRVSPRESNSVSENLNWLNTTNPIGTDFLQLNPNFCTSAESGAIKIPGYNDDYNINGSRASFPLNGQTNLGGTNPDIGAIESDLCPSSNYRVILAQSGNNGTIQPSGRVITTIGSTKKFIIEPSLGYFVDSFIVDGIKVDSILSYTFNNLISEHTISVTFFKPSYINISGAHPSGSFLNTNTLNNIVASYQMVDSNSSSLLKSISFTSKGTYTSLDIQNMGFKCWINSTNDLVGATQIGSNRPAVASGGVISLSGLSQNIPIGTSYILVTCDISNRAVNGNTIGLSNTPIDNFSFSGSTVISGLSTLAATNLFTINETGPVKMQYRINYSYKENFIDEANWTNGFANGLGAGRWAGVTSNAGTIPNATAITVSTANFQTSSSGAGIQRGSLTGNVAGTLAFLSLGNTDNTSACAVDFFMDYTRRNADSLIFDAATVFNGVGNRNSTLRVYWSIDGTNFTELTGSNLPYTATNNMANSATIRAKLPTAFNNVSTCRLRFYCHNGIGGTTGLRPKISIDNVQVSAVNVKINLKMFFEAFYENGRLKSSLNHANGSSQINLFDTVQIMLFDSMSNAIVHNVKSIVDTGGVCQILIPSTYANSRYYIGVKHRGSIETWSNSSVLLNNGILYDFTTAASKAYSDNLVNDGTGIYLIYNGDINQDGSVDFNDYPDLDIGSYNGNIGYFPTDLNGDASVDFNDYPILDINSNNGILAFSPFIYNGTEAFATSVFDSLGIINTGTLYAGMQVINATSVIPYTLVYGGTYPTLSINSTGVTGLTATLEGGTLMNSSGVLNFIITGTPNTNGTAIFTINVGGKTFVFTHFVNAFAIGTWYQGGIVSYIYQPGDTGYVAGQTHGFVLSPIEQGAASWGCYGNGIGTSSSIGSGLANTNAIVAGCSQIGIAARLCKNLNLNGYSDWFLPSKSELQVIYNNRGIINSSLFGIGGTALSNWLWSSSENNADNPAANAWFFNFPDGYANYGNKPPSFAVRAVRAF